MKIDGTFFCEIFNIFRFIAKPDVASNFHLICQDFLFFTAHLSLHLSN
jgi:hypothetical protein